MSTEFQWTDELIQEYAEYYRFSSSRTTLEQFKASKQPKREWEIVAYRHKDGELIERSNDSWQWIYANNGKQDYQIYSVKRLSDGTTWTIKDKFSANAGCDLTIKGFEIDKEGIKVWSVEYGFWWLRELKKVPLFITEDGVDYYASGGKKIYCLHDPGQWHIDEHPEFYEQLKQSYNRFFSTKEKAEEYKLFNAPLLSLEEIKRHGGNINYDNPYFKTLIQKAKDKLSPTT